MKRLIAVAAVIFTVCGSAAFAQGGATHLSGGIGFHNVDAPVGVRWWVTDKVAIDAGVGLGSDENTTINENLSHSAIDIGVPILLSSWDRVHVALRPGVLWRSQEVVLPGGPPFDTDSNTSMAVSAEIETEVFLADNFSVSASQGFAIVNTDPAVGESTSDWGTTGANFTNIGFHVYLFGRK